MNTKQNDSPADTKPGKRKPRNRYARPEIKPETLKQMNLFRFLIGEAPLPEGADDAWLWEEARTVTGRPLHRYLRAMVRAAMAEEQMKRIAPDPPEGPQLMKHLYEARASVFQTVTDAALKRGDAAYFRHVADCIELTTHPPKREEFAESFKAAVLFSYQMARSNLLVQRNPLKDAGTVSGEAGRKMWNSMIPTWLDLREAMERSGRLPNNFLKKDLENQRKQIEDTLRRLKLPFAQKRDKN